MTSHCVCSYPPMGRVSVNTPLLPKLVCLRLSEGELYRAGWGEERASPPANVSF